MLIFACGAASAAEPELTATKTKESVEFNFGDDKIATYVIAASAAKPYFWPLYAPGNIAVTRAWPMVKGTAGETTDHVHQKSAWFCHGDVIPEALELKTKSADKHVQGVDFWSETAGHGTIICIDVGDIQSVNPAMVRVPTKNEWRSADGDVILVEERTIEVRKLAKGYLLILEIDLLAKNYAVAFGDTKEGSLGVRVPDGTRLQLKDGGSIVSSDGKSAKAGDKDNLPLWGIPADWHDYSGKHAGIAIFDDPKNSERALWHTRAYGLMAANPFGREKSGFPGAKGKTELIKLAKGEHLKLRYGVYTHTGDAKTGAVGEAFNGFTGKK